MSQGKASRGLGVGESGTRDESLAARISRPARFVYPHLMVEEKRVQSRKRVLKDGRVLLPGSRVTYDCAIRDVSNTGAKIRLKIDSITLPNEFELVFVADSMAYPVVRKWQRGQEAGVAFGGSPRPVKARIN